MSSKNHGGGRNPKNATARKGGRKHDKTNPNKTPDMSEPTVPKADETVAEVKAVEPVPNNVAPEAPKHPVGSLVSFNLAAGVQVDATVTAVEGDKLDLSLIVPELHLHHLPAEEQKPDAVPKRANVAEGTTVGTWSAK